MLPSLLPSVRDLSKISSSLVCLFVVASNRLACYFDRITVILFQGNRLPKNTLREVDTITDSFGNLNQVYRGHDAPFQVGDGYKELSLAHSNMFPLSTPGLPVKG